MICNSWGIYGYIAELWISGVIDGEYCEAFATTNNEENYIYIYIYIYIKLQSLNMIGISDVYNI